MSSIVQRIRDYLHSPKGREQVEKAKTMARDPRNQHKLRRLVNQFRGHRTHH